MFANLRLMQPHSPAIRLLAERAGLSDSALAGALGVTKSHLSEMLSGKKRFGQKHAQAIAHELGVPIAVIILPESAA